MEIEGKKPYQRTSPEQLEYFLQFSRNHPELRQNKNDPTNPKRIQTLWADLAGNLNALKGPTRTPAKWKETLNHWKIQVRSRARKLKVAAKLTGGGPPPSSLSELEQRALETFDGGLLIDGIPNVPSLGMQEITDEILECQDEESSAPIIEYEDSLSASISNNLESLPSPPATKPGQLDKMFDKACKMIERRQESDRQLKEQQQQILQQQQATVTALKALADVIADLKKK